MRPATLLKKRVRHRCFPVKSEKIFKNTLILDRKLHSSCEQCNLEILQFKGSESMHLVHDCSFLILQNEIENKTKIKPFLNQKLKHKTYLIVSISKANLMMSLIDV